MHVYTMQCRSEEKKLDLGAHVLDVYFENTELELNHKQKQLKLPDKYSTTRRKPTKKEQLNTKWNFHR